MTATPTISWPDDLTVSSLQLIADSMTAMTGFGVAAISLVGEDDHLYAVAVSGPDEARDAVLGTRSAIDHLLAELAVAEDWGQFRFIPAERLAAAGLEPRGWIPVIAPNDSPDAWDPLDRLVAPLLDGDGRLRGVLTIDLPGDGRRPDEAKRVDLNRYAAQAGRAIVTAIERARLAREVALAEAVRRVIREAGQLDSLNEIMQRTAPALMECFDSAGLWWRVFGDGEPGPGLVIWRDDRPADPDLAIDPFIAHAARRLWSVQDVLILGPEQVRNVSDPVGARLGLEWVAGQGLASVMIVPIGVADTCLGAIGLSRAAGHAPWSEAEQRTALLLTSDIGRALHNTFELQREQQLVRDLRALDTARSVLLRTVSHELKNPLTSVLGNVELLQEDELADDLVAHAISRIERGADRMTRIISDLTAFSVAGSEPRREPVDLLAVVREVCDLTARSSTQRDQSLSVKAPDGPVIVYGDAGLLDRVVINLVSNAIKYTPEQGHVTVALARVETAEGPMVELAVSDDGIGISATDQARLFTEFFRSADPRAKEQPGTGLGLAITERIVARHGGTITVESTLGAGSTFRVRLPGVA